jgi:hypothetical protein
MTKRPSVMKLLTDARTTVFERVSYLRRRQIDLARAFADRNPITAVPPAEETEQ